MNPQIDTEVSNLVQRHAERHAAPAALHARIVAAARHADAPSRTARAVSRGRQWLNMGVAFALGVLASVTVVLYQGATDAHERLTQDVVSSHVRSLMAAHLADVASSDRHTVKPWFAGKLDFSPPVHDLAAAGFPLVGGRLEYVGDRPAAALVYQRRQHVINLFVWPRDAHASTPPASAIVRGFNVTAWENHGMQFWAVSDLNADELQAFGRRLQMRDEAPAASGKPDGAL
ncbi:MAG: anti-sigma factor [Thiobacillus sp.]|nr:anti-sigma factor [Thiobacillus sp.]